MKKQEILQQARLYHEAHPYQRWGQSVFNYIDETFGIARTVQFTDKIDCFYDSRLVDVFIEHCLNYINNGIR